MYRIRRISSGLRSGLRPGAMLLVIVLVSMIPYRHLIGRGLTDPDDFKEIYRASAVDLPDPSRILLEPHEGNRYRPINRLLTAASTAIGGGAPGAFLVRNLLLHLINACLVFCITLTLASNPWPAALAAALFALHPANVNSVGIAVFTQSFSTSLLLLSLYLLSRRLAKERPGRDYTLALVSVILIVVTFSSEMYLWVLPTYVIALLWWRIKGDTQWANGAALVLAVAGLGAYLVMRQLVLGQQGLPTLVSGGRYGLRTPVQVLQNLGMFLVSGGLSLDFLHFINPIVQTLPTSPGALIANPGILLAVVLGLVFAVLTLAAGAAGFVLRTRSDLRLSFAFGALFLVSVSVVLVTTSASETHLYTANSFLAIGAGLATFELGKDLFESNQSKRLVGRWTLVGVILLILTLRAIGAENRNQVLVYKARQSQKLQEELVSATANCRTDEIVITSACPLPEGYSVYGGTGMELFLWPGFAELSLDNFSVSSEVVNLAQLESGELGPGAGDCVVVVDMEGNIYRYPQRRSEWKCE